MHSPERFLRSPVFTQTVGGVNLSFKSKFAFDTFCAIPSTNLLVVGGKPGFFVWRLDPSGFLAEEKFLGKPFPGAKYGETVRSISVSERGDWITADVVEDVGLLWKDMGSMRIVEAMGKWKVDKMILSPDGKWIVVVIRVRDKHYNMRYRTLLYATQDLFRKGMRANKELDFTRVTSNIVFSPGSDRLMIAFRDVVIIYSYSSSGWSEMAKISDLKTFTFKGVFTGRFLFMIESLDGDDLLYVNFEDRDPAATTLLKDVKGFVSARDGNHVLASDEEKTLFLRTDSQKPEEVMKWSRESSEYVRYCFSPHGNLLASFSEGKLQLRDENVLGTFEFMSVRDCAFSWDENWFITARENREIFVWDMDFLRSFDTPDYPSFRKERIRAQ